MDLEKEPLGAAGSQDPTPSPAAVQKTDDILDACRWKDRARLRSLSQSKGGFLNDELRSLAWPILLGLPPRPPNKEKGNGTASLPKKDAQDGQDSPLVDWRRLPRHPDEHQVQLDVNRSFVYYPKGSDEEIEIRKQELSNLIREVLRRNPYLCYFQGYHDICQVFLLVLPPELRASSVTRLSILRIRDFMLPSLVPTTTQLWLLPGVLALADPKLQRHIAGIEPYYAIAGTLTMYSYNIEGYDDITRVFDVILAHEPVFAIYMFAQIVIDRRDEILDIDEPDMLQVILSRVPSGMDLDALVDRAIELAERFPPETLPAWRRVSRASVLKTARDLDACAKQTLDDGRALFEKQVDEIRRQEMRQRLGATLWAYRRTTGMFAVAVIVGYIAVHLKRNPSTLQSILGLFSWWKR